MSKHNKSRSQGNPRGLRTSDAREVSSPGKQARPNGGRPTSTQPLQKVADLVLSDGREQVEQLAHQATDLATHAAKATANTMTRATRATRDAVARTGTAALAMVRANPVPIALAGVGVACAGIGVSWLIMSKAKSTAHARPQSDSQSGGAASHDGSKHDGTVKPLANGAAAKASDLAHRAGAQATQLELQLETMVKRHPIATGAALLAVGAAIGLAIPRTLLEDTWIGQQRDRLMASARKVVNGVWDKGKVLAQQAVQEAASITPA